MLGPLDTTFGTGGPSMQDLQDEAERRKQDAIASWTGVENKYGVDAQAPIDEQQLAAVRALQARANGFDSAARLSGAANMAAASAVPVPDGSALAARQAVMTGAQGGMRASTEAGQQALSESMAMRNAALQAQQARVGANLQGQSTAQAAELAKAQQLQSQWAAQQQAAAAADQRRAQLTGQIIGTGAQLGTIAMLTSDTKSKRMIRVPKGWVK